MPMAASTKPITKTLKNQQKPKNKNVNSKSYRNIDEVSASHIDRLYIGLDRMGGLYAFNAETDLITDASDKDASYQTSVEVIEASVKRESR